MVADEGFKGDGEDLLSGVFDAFFEIVEGHGFGEGFVERVDFGCELVDEVLALFWAEFWHGSGYFSPHHLRCTLELAGRLTNSVNLCKPLDVQHRSDSFFSYWFG